MNTSEAVTSPSTLRVSGREKGEAGLRDKPSAEALLCEGQSGNKDCSLE
jgi:hypothetical protein